MFRQATASELQWDLRHCYKQALVVVEFCAKGGTILLDCYKPTMRLNIDIEILVKDNESAPAPSVERAFDGVRVPAWWEQVTVRALVVSLGLSVMLSVIVMELNLMTGIIPSLNVTSGLLGFFFVKVWPKALEHACVRVPFTRQANTVIQTCVVAACGLAFNGLFSLVPLRKIMIIDYKLIYPSGTATAYLINGFHIPQGRNLAKSCTKPPNSLHGLQGYRVFIAISIILGDGLYNFIKVLTKTVQAFVSDSQKIHLSTLPVSDEVQMAKQPIVSYDDDRRAEVFLKDQIPKWVAIGGYSIVSLVSIITLPHIFPPLKWYFILVAYALAPVLAFCNAYGCGLTDWNMSSIYRKLAILSLGLGQVPTMALCLRALLPVGSTVSLTTKALLTLCYILSALAILINLARDLFLIRNYDTMWQKMDRTKAAAFDPAAASGLICGDGIWSLPEAVLALAQVKPPICMKFLSRKMNEKLDSFINSAS
ncbi:hypothetical protein ZIOFF_026112 [Zingiber officinale]|uniref:Uncharacterized protein n=1 Tax=Zingiber officinale TaxID=94328 RepID=A0A8J5H3K8_ZINOF|nr:hypothetical protein ZIOFF_026112 [Zingiber officinale]